MRLFLSLHVYQDIDNLGFEKFTHESTIRNITITNI